MPSIFRGSFNYLKHRLLPVVVLVPLAVGWLILLAQRIEFYNAMFGVALCVLSTAVILIITIWHSTEQPEKTEPARQAATAELSDWEKQYRLVFENTPCPVFIYNVNSFAFLAVNQAAVKQYGYSQEEFLSMTIKDLSLPDEIPSLLNAHDNGKISCSQTSVYQHRRKDASIILVEISFHTMIFNGQLARLALVNDITKHKEVENALRKSAERYYTVTETAADAIVTITKDGKILFVNLAAERIFGYKVEQLLGNNLAMLIPQYPGYLYQTNLSHLNGQSVELPARRYDGEEIQVEISFSVFVKNDKSYFTSVIRDITGRKLIEKQLQAKQAAEAVQQTQTEFLTNMSHEIRTPLNGIIGMTELALKTELSPHQREYLTMVKSSANALLYLLNDILDFSKIDAGRLQLDAVAFSLRESLGNTLKILAMDAHEKGLELNYRITLDVPDMLIGDPGRLNQIVVNLIGNAIKFTTHGEVNIQVKRVAESASELTLYFEISDTGIGIPVDKQQLIFDAFVQADSSITRQFGGPGLGLTISAQLVAMMGGSIELRSEPGKGSTFHFTARFQPQEASTLTRSTQQAALQGMPVLIVDDNSTNQLFLSEMLTNWGMKSVVAGSGSSALSQLQLAVEANKPFSLVLLDALMPQMDGFIVAEQIRKESKLSNTIIIMMLSSPDKAAELARCQQLNISTYLRKPLKESELLEMILSTLKLAPVPEPVVCQPEGETFPPCSKSLRILLAEDNPVNQELAKVILKNRHHQVTVAINGHEALELWRKEKFDLILMDVQMPEMDGLTATAAIREKEQLSGQHIKIIAMTAHAMKGARERCLAAGMDGYIAKPILPEQLLAIVEGWEVLPSNSLPEAKEDTTDGVFNINEALARVLGERELLCEMADLFLEDATALLTDMRDSIAAQDGQRLSRAAHRLKGAAGHFGAQRTCAAARELEKIGQSTDLTRANQVYADLEKELSLLKQALKAIQ
ncbi:MAG: response regulator [Acidobacteriota bacterium]